MLSKLIEERSNAVKAHILYAYIQATGYTKEFDEIITTSMELAYEAGKKEEKGNICAFAIKSIQARFKAGKEAGMSHEALETFVIESFVLPKDNKETILSENTPPQPNPSEDLAV